MKPDRLAYLMDRCKSGEETPEEREELMVYLEQPAHVEAAKAFFRELYEQDGMLVDMGPEAREGILSAIFQAPGAETDLVGNVGIGRDRVSQEVDGGAGDGVMVGARKWWKPLAAAAVTISVVVSVYYLYTGKQTGKAVVVPDTDQAAPLTDLPPGTNKATLTLAGGRTIVLDSAGKGMLANERGVQVIKQDSGKLLYRGAGKVVEYNTLATPKGGQYQLTLPDGTRVWLNAASSIRYPTAFANGARGVEITGEAYFEATNNPHSPFVVHAGDVSVVVLGTHFNVMAYPEEGPVRTTLEEGSVRVIRNKAEVVIHPGEQTWVSDMQGAFQVSTVNMDMVLAWKNGLFKFDRSGLDEVLKQFARWYDVEVVYEQGIPNLVFGGEMGRDLSLSQALDGLARMGLHYKIEGKKLIIKK